MDLGWFGPQDVTGAVDFLSRQPDVDPHRIAVVGFSMGGEEGLAAAALDARIAAVVSDSGSAMTWSDVSYLAGRRLTETLLAPSFFIAYHAAGLMTTAPEPMPLIEAMTRIAPRPVLLVASSEEPEATLIRHLQDAAPATTQLWEPPNTPHMQASYVHQAEWTARVTSFLGDALLRVVR